jgi:hypothetical protein
MRLSQVGVVARGAGQAKGFGIPVPGVAVAAGLALGLEAEVRRRKIVPDATRGLVAEILRLDERRAIAARDAVAAEDASPVSSSVRRSCPIITP